MIEDRKDIQKHILQWHTHRGAHVHVYKCASSKTTSLALYHKVDMVEVNPLVVYIESARLPLYKLSIQYMVIKKIQPRLIEFQHVYNRNHFITMRRLELQHVPQLELRAPIRWEAAMTSRTFSLGPILLDGTP